MWSPADMTDTGIKWSQADQVSVVIVLIASCSSGYNFLFFCATSRYYVKDSLVDFFQTRVSAIFSFIRRFLLIEMVVKILERFIQLFFKPTRLTLQLLLVCLLFF